MASPSYFSVEIAPQLNFSSPFHHLPSVSAWLEEQRRLFGLILLCFPFILDWFVGDISYCVWLSFLLGFLFSCFGLIANCFCFGLWFLLRLDLFCHNVGMFMANFDWNWCLVFFVDCILYLPLQSWNPLANGRSEFKYTFLWRKCHGLSMERCLIFACVWHGS